MAKRKAKSKSSPKKKAATKKKVVKRKALKKARKPKRAAKKKTVSRSKTKSPGVEVAKKYMSETGMSYSKPQSISEFDKKLEETAKILQTPEITSEHKTEAKEQDVQKEEVPAPSKEPEPHHTMMSNEKLYAHKHNYHVAHHDKVAIWGIVLAIVGVLVPLASIAGIIVASVAVKKGSHTGKGTVLLGIFTLILNLVLIYLFIKIFLI